VGFLGSIGRAIGGGVVGFISGGPAGAVAGAATGLFGGGSGGGPVPATGPNIPILRAPMGPIRGFAPQEPVAQGQTGPLTCPGGMSPTPVDIKGPFGITRGTRIICQPTQPQEFFPATGTTLPATTPVMPMQAGNGCATGCCTASGQRGKPNKTGYYVKGGAYVAPGTRCVSRRSINPANGKAAVRAIRRVEATHNLLKRIDKRMQAVARRSAPRRRRS